MKICLLTKKNKYGVKEVINYLNNISDDIEVYFGEDYISIPKSILKKEYDFIISYISPWIVPKSMLNKTNYWNINFHPGPPEYPGIGCFNFAIYDSAYEFGSTAHIMDPKVDSGKIIGVKRFKMKKDETVETLSLKTYKAQLNLFKKIMKTIIIKKSLPKSEEKWKRVAYKRIELEKLSEINLNMTSKEIQKRIRATYYSGKPAPFIKILGHKFEFNPNR